MQRNMHIGWPHQPRSTVPGAVVVHNPSRAEQSTRNRKTARGNWKLCLNRADRTRDIGPAHTARHYVAKTPWSRGSGDISAPAISGTPGGQAAARGDPRSSSEPSPSHPAQEAHREAGAKPPQDHIPAIPPLQIPRSTSPTPPCAPAAHRSPEPLLL